MLSHQYNVAVILPCYNEAGAIAKTVADFRKALPDSSIYVYDNNSTDDTAKLAAAAGAIVRTEPILGKGNVVRRAFTEIDADVYVIADGDGTYDVSRSMEMIEMLDRERLDMVVGVRRPKDKDAFRSGHKLGNKIFTLLVGNIMGYRLEDVFSGYRVFSRPYVKSFPALATGFETEMEMSLHALNLKLPLKEIYILYGERTSGTRSKLKTWQDGTRILLFMIYMMSCHYRPLLIFWTIAVFFLLLSLVIGIPVVIEYLKTGLVTRFPTAFAAASMMIIAFISFIVGPILFGISHGIREQKRVSYLNISRYKKSAQ